MASPLSDLVSGIARGLLLGLVEAAVARLNKPAPSWRWGHSYIPGSDNRCVYCLKFIPGQLKVTATPCVGPDHKLSQSELGR